ncbi:hypothetical protein ACFQ1Q_05300 [Winogradskyella litorisediminis]|uniref:Uncharacterized protein n=1 Tax=Winogradskyella litorisediminis TaxID=1156618 RepID=A0ABW3N6Q0_9FLAO
MKKILFLFLIAFQTAVFSQINNSNVLTNDQAMLIAQKDGYQTLNIPIFARYNGITEDQTNILAKLKNAVVLEYTVVNPVKKVIDTKLTYIGNDLVAAQTRTQDNFKNYIAVALVEVDKVIEVRQHQTKNNAQTVYFQFRLLNISKAGKALGFKAGQTITHNVDYVNTSNGWAKDIEDLSDQSITDYRKSKYGPTGLSNYKSKLQDIEFIKGIRTRIVGKWNRNTDKEKRREHYVFNEDGTYENYLAKKDQTNKGKFKFSTNYGDEIVVALIPREGKNKSIRLKRSKWGMYISGKPYEKEGSTNETSNTDTAISRDELAVKKNKILEAKKRLYGRKLNGFWKSPNGKVTLDFKESKTLTFKEKKNSYENATYDLTILDGKLYMIIFDKDLVEVYNEELKVVRDDQMTLNGKTFIKF